MTSRADRILSEALTLSKAERAGIAAALLAGLDEGHVAESGLEAAWAREIERRARRIMAGSQAGEPWDDVRARVARRLVET